MSDAIATWKDLCIDAVNAETEARFWAAALGLEPNLEPGRVRLTGPTPQHTVWINDVLERYRVKNRVHLDVHAGSVEDLVALGARPLVQLPHWTVMSDLDGQEFCAFVRDAVPAYRLYELVVDAHDAVAQARWWSGVFGVEAQTDDDGDWWAQPPGAPFDGMVFGPVPEPKTIKNRVHWDVTGDVDALVAAGATVLRTPDDEIRWTVMADPEGNEFCAFAPAV